MAIQGVLETCLYVDDLAVAERFYDEVLSLRFVSRQEGRHVFFQCGDGMLLLFKAAASNAADSDLPRHGTQGAGHIAFAIASDEIPSWHKRLTQNGVAIEQTVDWPRGGRSLYFRDPAGNSLELASASIWGLGELQSTAGGE